MRTIPIGRAVPSLAAGCGPADEIGEGSGLTPKLDLPLGRREFLRGSGVLTGTLAFGSLLASLAPSPVWALEMKTLSQREGETLIAMGRVLYPHAKLPDAVYALLVKDLDAKASGKADAARELRDGLAALDRAAGGSFAGAPAAKRLELVKAIEGQPFFGTVRAQCVTSLYDNDMAYTVFGYPGSAWEKGGYITRGFQDLTWLPAPTAEASPPSYMG